MTLQEANREVHRKIRGIPSDRSLHYVEGHRTKAENPHLYRLSTLNYNGPGVVEFKKMSGSVLAYFRQLGEPDHGPADSISDHARQVPDFVAPMRAYRTPAQRLAETVRAADRANKKKPPLIWHPISAERKRQLESTPGWSSNDVRRRSIEAARKRGDVLIADPDTTLTP